MASSSINELRSSPHRDEESEGFMEELENAMRCSQFIFEVPESVSRANPDAFLPRLITLGPHNAKNKMESYKLYMANKVRGELHLPEFDQLCSQLRTFKLRIQACYDTHLEIDGDNLARVMLVDALFLLRLLLNVSAQMEVSSRIKFPLPDFDDQIHSLNIDHNMLLNDVLKLQNQIPLLIFQGILPQPLKVKFPVLLYHFCQSLSPFALDFFRKPNVLVSKIDPYAEISDLAAILDQSHHLLHFMYLSILIFPGIYRITFIQHSGAYEDGDDSLTLTFFQKWFSKLESVLDFIQNFMELIGLIQKLVELIRMVKKQSFGHKTTSSNVIPSASQLHKLPVKFESTDDGILGTRFTKAVDCFFLQQGRWIPHELTENPIPPKLILPVMNINAFTETLFENLLAFEAMANINPPVFALYLELMKALIRTPKDVQFLKKKRIITSHLDSDEEVVKLFNRLGNSISNLKNPTIKNLQPMTFSFERINKYDEEYKGMVEEINQYYRSFWTVKARRYMKKFVSCVGKILGILVIFFQISIVSKKLVSSIIGNDEPNYDQIPAT